MLNLYIAGGCQEHGRNCFVLEMDAFNIMVDCGIIEGSATSYYPELSKEQIIKTKYLFLTHSHKDHTGALAWLIKNGFCGKIISTEETRLQVGIHYDNWMVPILKEQQKQNENWLPELKFICGRSGHCIGSIWILFLINTKKILFTGDYSEQSELYYCDHIRGITADCAVVDCAYGNDIKNMNQAKKQINDCISDRNHRVKLFPVPKYGRSLEILFIVGSIADNTKIYADELVIQQVENNAYGWHGSLSQIRICNIKKWDGKEALIFLSDPQLKETSSKELVDRVIQKSGEIIFSGYVYKNTYAEELMKKGLAKKIDYPVHMDYESVCRMVMDNRFKRVIPNHAKHVIIDEKHVMTELKTGDSICLMNGGE